MLSFHKFIMGVLAALIVSGCQIGSSDSSSGGGKATAHAFVSNDRIIVSHQGVTHTYGLEFNVLYRNDNPDMKLRPAGLDGASYNVPTWLAIDESLADLEAKARDAATAGDGFDASILEGSASARTANYFASGYVIKIKPNQVTRVDDTIHLHFNDHEKFSLSASITIGGDYPQLDYTLKPRAAGFYSVGFAGSPAFDISKADEIWQPLLWQEMSFPDRSYLTLAYRATLPTTMVRANGFNYGLLAHPKEFPFDPLPVADNSRFGVLLRNQDNKAQPMLFAPVMGGIESKMAPGEQYSFSSYIVAEKGDAITDTYENLARKVYGFKDHRNNEVVSLNTTFENIVDYSLTEYAWFERELKGAAYSTDVPGAVKNVASLNALELALVTDNREMFEERAYPTLEYMLSREKFLFSLDSEQKIQNPSRNMHGPIAPISELTALYTIFGGANDFFVSLAEKEYNKTRTRNLDVVERGDSWWNSLWLYKATGKSSYLDKAISGADEYLATRVDTPATQPSGFFWTQFTPRFIELVELYEVTQEKRYLDAAQKVARQYTMFTWMSPKIPDTKVLVNEGNKAPMYWYLKSKGHKQMYIDEEAINAWQLSEIGLTPESSGTSSGHRAIFMANYAPWMLRIGHYANDQFLRDIAKSAIIGRYENFPGYHINTARTSIYMKQSYPLRSHLDLSVNSFHYNHILPMASMLLDYLVTDVYARSEGAVNFPSEYIEGYAYLQNKFYGHAPGTFYGEDGVTLWMPKGLLNIENVELNYISGYKGSDLYIAFTNQSNEKVITRFTLDDKAVDLADDYSVTQWRENRPVGTSAGTGPEVEVEVAANGITVLKISGATPYPSFRQQFNQQQAVVANDYLEAKVGDARAMLIKLGNYDQRIYVYLRQDDSVISSASLRYVDAAGVEQTLVDDEFPYEWTIHLGPEQTGLEFSLQTLDKQGHLATAENLVLGN